MKAHRGNKSLMSILLNTLLLYPDHPYDFDEIWARAFDPQAKEYVKFLVTEPENLTREALYAKERALIADVKEELRQGRRCQIYATFTGEKDVTLRLETVLRQEGIRVAVLRSSVPTDKREDWSSGISHTLFLRDRLFLAHTTPGQPKIVAHRAEIPGASEVRHVLRHYAGDVPSSDGQKDAGGPHDGR
jgi:hypothetical protein